MASGLNECETLTDVCNVALQTIGEAELTDVETDKSNTAAVMRAVLVSVMREVQGSAQWAELVKTTTLSWTGNTSDTRGSSFFLPSDCMAVISCGSDGTTDYELESGRLYADVSSPSDGLVCRYMRFSQKPAEWSDALLALTVKLLAARANAGITSNVQQSAQLEAQVWQVDRPRIMAQYLNRVRNVKRYDGSTRGYF